VSSTNQVKVVSSKEFLKLFTSEDISATSFVLLPVSCIIIWVIPKQVCYKPAVWDIGGFGDLFNLFKTMHIFGDASVHTHDFFVNQCDHGHMVEATIKRLPE
jgi:hypothetical protein